MPDRLAVCYDANVRDVMARQGVEPQLEMGHVAARVVLGEDAVRDRALARHVWVGELERRFDGLERTFLGDDRLAVHQVHAAGMQGDRFCHEVALRPGYTGTTWAHPSLTERPVRTASL